MSTNSFAASQWDVTQLKGSISASDIDAFSIINAEALDRLAYTYRQDCALVYASASTITVNSGALALPNATGSVVRWRRNTSNTTVSWANIDTGAEASSTTYYVYGVADTDVTTFTVKISTNSSAPTGATYYRRLGSFYNDASGNITQITNDSESGNISYVKGQGNYYKIDSGTTGACGNQSYQELAVSFTFTFASTPKVVISANGSWGSLADYYTLNITTTGFTLATGNNYPVTYNYVAVGQVLTQ